MHVTALAPLRRQPLFRHSLGPSVDDPIRSPMPLRPSPDVRSTQQARSLPLSRSASAERCFPSHSPTLRPWIVDRLRRWSASYVKELWSPSLARHSEKRQAKAHANYLRSFQRQAPRVFLSRAGPRFDLELVQAGHHLWFRRLAHRLRNDEGYPVGRPRLACYAG